LRAAIDAYARAKLTAEDFIPNLEIAAEIHFDEITPQLFEHLQMLEPFGVGNRRPVFVARSARVLQPPRILKDQHIKLRVNQAIDNGKVSRPFDAMGWRMARTHHHVALGDSVDLAFTVDENTHPDFGGLQLTICDFQPATEAV